MVKYCGKKRSKKIYSHNYAAFNLKKARVIEIIYSSTKTGQMGFRGNMNMVFWLSLHTWLISISVFWTQASPVLSYNFRWLGVVFIGISHGSTQKNIIKKRWYWHEPSWLTTPGALNIKVKDWPKPFIPPCSAVHFFFSSSKLTICSSLKRKINHLKVKNHRKANKLIIDSIQVNFKIL